MWRNLSLEIVDFKKNLLTTRVIDYILEENYGYMKRRVEEMILVVLN